MGPKYTVGRVEALFNCINQAVHSVTTVLQEIESINTVKMRISIVITELLGFRTLSIVRILNN
jgi:hypothetical protein